MTHKYASVIKAWADGAQVEGLYKGEWMQVANPDWAEDRGWRIADPNKVTSCEWLADRRGWFTAVPQSPNLRLTFQGDKLVGAEVL